jgi:hypothetical protein
LANVLDDPAYRSARDAYDLAYEAWALDPSADRLRSLKTHSLNVRRTEGLVALRHYFIGLLSPKKLVALCVVIGCVLLLRVMQ